MIVYKVYTSCAGGVQTRIKYVSGKRMIEPASEASEWKYAAVVIEIVAVFGQVTFYVERWSILKDPNGIVLMMLCSVPVSKCVIPFFMLFWN